MPNTTTLNETTRSPIDGTEYVRLATPGANWKAQLSAMFPTVATGNMVFYVSTTGSDSNNGLSAGSPWATIAHAFAVISNIDWGQGFQPAIQFAPGTYNGTNQGFGGVDFTYHVVNVPALRGFAGGVINLVGDNTTPANVVFDLSKSQWQFGLNEDAIVAPFGIHFKTDQTVFATAAANPAVYLKRVRPLFVPPAATPNIEVEAVSGSGNFSALFFGTFQPGASQTFLSSAGAKLVASNSPSITLSGASAVASDFFGFACTSGGGCVIDVDNATFTFTSDFHVEGGGFYFADQYTWVFTVTNNANYVNPTHIIGPGVHLTNSSSIQTDVDPTNFPGTVTPFVDHFSAWEAGLVTSVPYLQILFPTLVAGAPPTTSDLFNTGWGVFDSGAGGIWLAANKSGTIFKVQLV